MVKETKKEKEKIKQEKEKTAREKGEMAHHLGLKFGNTRQDYIKNIINGRYYLARCNMISIQINGKEIKEDIDGCLKTEEYMRAEYALMKMQAINSMRNAHFARKILTEEFKFTKADINAIEEDYYDGKIIREDYDESYRKKTKAEFIDTSKG